MCKLLENDEFIAIKQKGSHRFYKHIDGRTTVVPMHSTDLDRTLIRKILKDIDMSIDDYNDKSWFYRFEVFLGVMQKPTKFDKALRPKIFLEKRNIYSKKMGVLRYEKRISV